MTSEGARADSNAQPRVSVVILNWRGLDDTLACVASAAALDYENLDILVCDNDSGDGSFTRISDGILATLDRVNGMRGGCGMRPFAVERFNLDDAIPETTDDTRRIWIVATGRNGGYAFGNNIGIRLSLLKSDVEFVWILNNDTLVRPDSLRALVHCMKADSHIGICGAKVLYLGRNGEVQALGGGRFRPSRARCEQIGEGLTAESPVNPRAVEAELSYVNGAVALVSRALIEQIGLMDEGYFLYWEEIDWATRARAQGRFRLGFCPEAVVYHRVGAATGSNDHGLPSLSSTYWMTRSKFRYLRKHRPGVLVVAIPLLFKAAAREIWARRPERAKVMLRGAFGLPVGR